MIQQIRRPKVLIVDDDETIIELLKFSFRGVAFDVEFCTSGAEAMETVFRVLRDGRPFDAYVLDCALPHFDGFTMEKIIRLAEATGICPASKIGFFTAYPLTVEQSTLLEKSTAERYWQKDSDVVELPRLVGEWLEVAQ